MNESPRLSKYSVMGGIARVAENVTRGLWTLETVAQRVTVSREMVRQDIQLHLGKGEYAELMARRRLRSKRELQPVIIPPEQAARLLSEMARRGNPKERERLELLRTAVKVGLLNGVEMHIKLVANKVVSVITDKQKPISFRLGKPGDAPENLLGFQRFKISRRNALKHPFTIFAIANGRGKTFYVFKSAEIADVKSLNLRFLRLGRKSKYSHALADWSLLNS